MKTYILPVIINVISIILTSYITHLLSISKFKKELEKKSVISTYERSIIIYQEAIVVLISFMSFRKPLSFFADTKNDKAIRVSDNINEVRAKLLLLDGEETANKFWDSILEWDKCIVNKTKSDNILEKISAYFRYKLDILNKNINNSRKELSNI